MTTNSKTLDRTGLVIIVLVVCACVAFGSGLPLLGWAIGLVSYIVGNIHGYRQGLRRSPSLRDEAKADVENIREVCINEFVDTLVEHLAKSRGVPANICNCEQCDALKEEIKAKARSVLK